MKQIKNKKLKHIPNYMIISKNSIKIKCGMFNKK